MKYKALYKKFKKNLLLLIPPLLLKTYHNIKNKYCPAPRKEYPRTSSQIIIWKSIVLNKLVVLEKNVDKVIIESYMEWVNPFDEKDSRKYQYNVLTVLVKDETKIVLDFTNYGAWTICINYFCNDINVGKEIKTINIGAPEYNIGYLAATIPVEIFLTKLWDITSVNKPTIVGLERVLINYEKLPQWVVPFPLASKEELNTAYKGFESYSQRLVSYIGALYRLNPEAKFNLYLCDHQAFYSLALMYANGIPEKNFRVYLLSDGLGSYNGFNHIFNCIDAEKKYVMMRDTWILSRQKALETGVLKWGKEVFVKCGNPCLSKSEKRKNNTLDLSIKTAYAYVMTKENSSYRWILHNPHLLKYANQHLVDVPNSIFKTNFVNNIKHLNNHKNELISMLGINYSVFDKSYQDNKKICLLLGSYPPSLDDEKYIDETISYFGNNYDYYFKEHPWTSQNVKRIQVIKNKGITVLDSRIPSEFYMMINPNIYIAGYLSSAFLSIGLLKTPEQILSIWAKTSREIKTGSLDFIAKTAMNIENNTIVIYK